MLKELKKYLNKGWSLIPIGINTKKPLVDWKAYQTKHPTQAELKKWFGDKRNVAVITGQISGITVIDCDSQQAFDRIKSIIPIEKVGIVQTPRGGYHIYFAYTPALKTNSNPQLKIDIRNDGGYVLLPPSELATAKYQWMNFPKTFAPVPEALISLLTTNSSIIFTEANLQLGGRDEGLFHLAYTLAKGGMRYEEIYNVLHPYAQMCKPPFPEKELKIKIESAIKRIGSREISLIDEVREYVNSATGQFSFRNVCNDLNIYTVADKKNVSKILNSLVEEGILEKSGRWNAVYRKKVSDLQKIELNKIEIPEPLDLKFPFKIEELVDIYPKNLIVIAGTQNIGKTLFMLNFIKNNMNKYTIHYFNSEMSEEELALRLKQFKVKRWKFNAYCRTTRFEDVIFPDDINIIDYLEVADEFWKIGQTLSRIHDKLNKGIALIGIQKSSQSLLGRGASFGLERPRLYLSMDRNQLIIVKAKNWHSQINPNFKMINFEIKGTDFKTDGVWYDYVPSEERNKR